MGEIMNCKKIIIDYLIENKYDGLVDPCGNCACITGDLFPCSESFSQCEAGYTAPCDCGDHDYHIVAGKRSE